MELARDVKEICDRHGVPLIPHFYPKAAGVLGPDIVHLPLWKVKELREPASQEADTMTPASPLRFGVSVHSAEEAREAISLGASYLIAGHVFATDCKKGAPPRGLHFLKEICRLASVPVYGIGGIRLDAGQISDVLKQGAAGGCIMSQMMRI